MVMLLTLINNATLENNVLNMEDFSEYSTDKVEQYLDILIENNDEIDEKYLIDNW